jgi:hypothetical protein
MMVTQERLKELLHYDPATGLFTWRVSRGTRKLGDIAGTVRNPEGYIGIRIDQKTYQAHRLVWLYVYGCWPSHEIDHMNHVTHDNSLVNLREASKSVNLQNQIKCPRGNRSGILGVHCTKNGRFQSCIGVGGKSIHLGTFLTADAARDAYLKAKRIFHEGNLL